MTLKRIALGAAVLGPCVGFTAGPAAAKADEVLYLSDDASYCDIFRGLSAILPGECAEGAAVSPGHHGEAVTRSIVRRGTEDEDLSQAEQSPAPDAEQADVRAIALRVQFNFDSAALSPQSLGVLTKVAAVLKNDLMSDNVIRVEGHTDAIGPSGYNQLLSERRALAVVDFLVKQQHVASHRFQSVGKGESEPLSNFDPRDGINRRVQFVNLGSEAASTSPPDRTSVVSGKAGTAEATDKEPQAANSDNPRVRLAYRNNDHF